jgi:hypothetical protein
MFVYLHMVSFCMMLLCFGVCFMFFLAVLCWVGYCEFVILCEIIYFLFVFLLCKYSYNYCFSFVCFYYGKFICGHSVFYVCY